MAETKLFAAEYQPVQHRQRIAVDASMRPPRFAAEYLRL